MSNFVTPLHRFFHPGHCIIDPEMTVITHLYSYTMHFSEIRPYFWFPDREEKHLVNGNVKSWSSDEALDPDHESYWLDIDMSIPPDQKKVVVLLPRLVERQESLAPLFTNIIRHADFLCMATTREDPFLMMEMIEEHPHLNILREPTELHLVDMPHIDNSPIQAWQVFDLPKKRQELTK